MNAVDPDSFRQALAENFNRVVPHAREMGIEVERVGEDGVIAHLPYRDDWLGDTERGVIHTGAVTSFVDSISGMAMLGRLGAFEAIATLDLRMDYLRPAVRDRTLHGRAYCYRFTSHIAFVRASVWQDDEAQPVAQSQSVFMRGSHSPKRGSMFYR